MSRYSKRKLFSACGCGGWACCRLSGPFAPSIKSLPSGLEILLFECGNRTSYKISRLEVIFVGPWGGALFRPFSGVRKRAPSRGRSSASDRDLQNMVLTQEGTNSCGCFCKRRAGARAWPPLPLSVSTTNWATLFLICRAIQKRKLFPLMSLPLPLPLPLPFIRPFCPVYKKPSKRIRNFIV